MDMPEGFKNFSKTKPMKIDHFAPVMEWWNKREEIAIDGFDKARRYTLKDIQDRSYNIDLCGFPQVEEVVFDPQATIVNYHERRQALNDKIDNVLNQISTLLGFEL
jgi:type I restriction enzyme M protein